MDSLAPLIFFALIGLIQLLVRWVRTIQQQQRQQEQQPPFPLPEHGEPRNTVPLPPMELPAPMRTPPPRRLIDNRVPDDEELLVRTPARPAPVVPPRQAARRRVHAGLGSRAEVRRAIVLMEILGPPRAAIDVEARGGR